MPQRGRGPGLAVQGPSRGGRPHTLARGVPAATRGAPHHQGTGGRGAGGRGAGLTRCLVACLQPHRVPLIIKVQGGGGGAALWLPRVQGSGFGGLGFRDQGFRVQVNPRLSVSFSPRYPSG